MRNFLAIAVIGLFLLVTGVYSQLTPEKPGKKADPGKDVFVAEHQAKRIETEKKAAAAVSIEAINPIDLTNKDEIQERMLNSYQFFDTAKGSFRYYSVEVPFDDLVEYKVKMKDNDYKLYVKLTRKKDNIGEEFYDNGKYTSIYHDSKIYDSFEMPAAKEKGKFKTVKEVYTKTPDGAKAYEYPDPPIQFGSAGNSLHSKEIAAGFLENQDQWDVEGVEDYLKRKAVVIAGNFGDYYKEKLSSVRFKIWMDQNTGILLKFATYDQEGNIVDALETIEIRINENFPVESAAKKIPAGYEKYVPLSLRKK